MVVKSSFIWTYSFMASNYRAGVVVLFCNVVRVTVLFFGADPVNVVHVI